MRVSQIQKLYLSNFLTGLIFWYGIEKLFMKSIGISAFGIGIATAVFLVLELLFDIPAGIVADKWSRRGVLVVSAFALAGASTVMGLSHGLPLYIAGEVLYAIYLVSTSGTYTALIYDILHSEGRAGEYSRIAGRAYGLFLAGAGVANIGSGFIAAHFSYPTTYFISVVPCFLNALLILTIHEPKFHKAEAKERMLGQLRTASAAIARIRLLRILTLILSAMTIADLFAADFGQLYMLRYFTAPQVIGLLWAVYAFGWALGSLIAHRLRARLHTLVIGATLPIIIMAFVDHWISLILFVFQAITAAALANQIETRIQENTPSAVRASILSVVSTLGTAISVPASLLMGLLIRDYNALWALRFVAIIAGTVLLYWMLAGRHVPRADAPLPEAVAGPA